MITVYLNKAAYPIQPQQSLKAFLTTLDHREQHCAIAINDQCIPRASYDSTELCDGDRIDIIVPMQGG